MTAAPPSASDARPPGRPKGGAIMLARHGRPALDRSKSMGPRAYKDWWAAYDEGGLAKDQTPPAALRQAALEADVILASPLRRSVETAAAVAAGKPFTTDSVFVEAPLPPPPLPGWRLKPGQWGVASRISWWLGWSGGQESRAEAEIRALRAVDRVEAAVGDDKVVLVCAHGWFNRMMRPVLLARGWRCVTDGRDDYWSLRRYERP